LIRQKTVFQSIYRLWIIKNTHIFSPSPFIHIKKNTVSHKNQALNPFKDDIRSFKTILKTLITIMFDLDYQPPLLYYYWPCFWSYQLSSTISSSNRNLTVCEFLFSIMLSILHNYNITQISLIMQKTYSNILWTSITSSLKLLYLLYYYW